MNYWHYDVLETIRRFLPETVPQFTALIGVNRHFRSLLDTQKHWYRLFKSMYPAWSGYIAYEAADNHISHWKDIVLDIARWNQRIMSLQLNPFVFYTQPEKTVVNPECRNEGDIVDVSLSSTKKMYHSKLHIEDDDWKYDEIFGKILFDINPITNEGIAGVTKYRNEGDNNKHESLINLWKHPSREIIHSFKVDFPCRFNNIQTIRVPDGNNGGSKEMTFFSLIVGTVDYNDILSEAMLIYCLTEKNDIQCVAFIDLKNIAFSPDAFLFSEMSWRVSDGHLPDENIYEWLRVISPEFNVHEPQNTIYMMSFGHTLASSSYHALLYQVNLLHKLDLDPLKVPATWDSRERCFVISQTGKKEQTSRPTTTEFWNLRTPLKYWGTHHIRYPPQLSHLIIGNNMVNNELVLYDWRYGVKVGVLSRRDLQTTTQKFSDMSEKGAQNADELEASRKQGESNPFQNCKVTPREYKIVTVLPRDALNPISSKDSISKRGLRLEVFGTDRNFHQRIESWDITHMMNVYWNPLDESDSDVESDITEASNESSILSHYLWRNMGQQCHRVLARTELTEVHKLPYSPPANFRSYIVNHSFRRVFDKAMAAAIAFEPLGTSIVLLMSTSELIIFDVESGNTLRRLNLKTVEKEFFQPTSLNVINGNEIFVAGETKLVHGMLK